MEHEYLYFGSNVSGDAYQSQISQHFHETCFPDTLSIKQAWVWVWEWHHFTSVCHFWLINSLEAHPNTYTPHHPRKQAVVNTLRIECLLSCWHIASVLRFCCVFVPLFCWRTKSQIVQEWLQYIMGRSPALPGVSLWPLCAFRTRISSVLGNGFFSSDGKWTLMLNFSFLTHGSSVHTHPHEIFSIITCTVWITNSKCFVFESRVHITHSKG